MRRFRINPTVQIVGANGLPTRDGFNLLQGLPDKYAADVPETTGTTATVKHGLGSSDIVA